MRNKIFYIDAAAIFLCCMVLSLVSDGTDTVTVVLLLTICTAALLALSGKALYVAEIALPLCTLLLPEEMTLLLPAAMYVSAANKHKLPMLTAALIAAAALFRYDLSEAVLFTAAMCLLSAALGLRTAELASCSDELKRTRDNSTEYALLLQNKNRELMKNQDNEVKLATLAERNRIAREIHDNVGHLLSRAILQSGALLAVTDKEKMPVQYEQTSALKETLGSAMNSIRESVHGLRDDSIDLHRAVNEAANAVSGKFKVTTELDFSEKMPANIKLCFIAVIKEALSNAVKYSNGNKISIIIREHPAIYQLYVTDNGKNAKIKHNSGMGLNNMRDRAEAVGGIFRVDTSDGFRIFISTARKTEVTADEDSSGRRR